MRKRKPIDPIPEEFAGFEEAAEFWDTHDTMDYPDAFQTVKCKTELRRRHIELEIDADVVKALRKRARRKGVRAGDLASDLLRRGMLAQK